MGDSNKQGCQPGTAPLVLVINSGSTSTKVAVWRGREPLVNTAITVSAEQIKDMNGIMDQKGLRQGQILDFIAKQGLAPTDFSIVASQSGSLPSIQGGAYYINELMVDVLERFPVFEHAASLGVIVAHDIARQAGIPAIIYDGNTTDEMYDFAKVTGLAGVERIPTSHILNTKAVARRVAGRLGRRYDECNFLMAHLGGGVSITAHKHGLVVDDIFDDEGPMAPQRAGLVPACQLIDICYSGEHTRLEMQRMIRGKGGMVALTGTADAREIEARITAGDEDVRLAYYAMSYQISKGLCSLAAVFGGQIDRVILTGGMAHSQLLTGWIEERVAFLAPVEVVPGEFEMEALALGALRVLSGEEAARDYDILPPNYTPKDEA